MMKTALAKIVTGKIAAIALATTAAAGGVAYAAGTGALPAGLGGDSHASARPTAAHDTTAKGAKEAQGSPSPSLVGLCHAYTAGAGDNPGKALDNPAFTALITAAGGKDKVAGYCATALVKPTKTAGKADSHPTGKPTTHPGTGRPTGKPATNPAGAPSALPTVEPSRTSH